VVEIRDKNFSIDEVIKKLKKPEIGGIIGYLGTVRETSLAGRSARARPASRVRRIYLPPLSGINPDATSKGKKVEKIEFADSEGLKQKLQEIEKKARDKFDIKDIAIIHRIGSLKVGEKILFLAVSAAHRGPAFAACRWIIDEIKNEVHSVWKKETY